MIGTLRERPFAEIVGAIFQGKQTGELAVTATGKAIAISFQDGNPVAAASDDPSHRISRILLDNGKIGLGEAEMLGGLPESKQAFETVEYISTDILLWGVKFRFLRLLEELFSWEDGEYSFTEGQVPPEALTLRVPTPFIIFTGTAKMAPAAFGSIGDEKTIAEVRKIPGEQESFFNPQRKKFLAACKPGMQVGELLAEMPGDRERARHALYAFKALGLVTLAEPPAAESPEPPLALFDDEVELEPEAEAPMMAPAAGSEPLDASAVEEPLSLYDSEESLPAETAELSPDGGEPEFSPGSSPGEEQGEMLPGAEEEAPLTVHTGPERSLEDAAPELPLHMPSNGEAEEELVLEEEAQSAGDADPGGFTLPPDETTPDAATIDDGLPFSRDMSLDAAGEESDILTEEPPEKPEEQKKGSRLKPPSRAGKVAALGAGLLLVIGGSLLGLKILKEKAVPPPDTATAVAPVQTAETSVPVAEPPDVAVPVGEKPVTAESSPTGEAEGGEPGAAVPATAPSGTPDPAGAELPSAAAVDSDRQPEAAAMSVAGDTAEVEIPTAEDARPALKDSVPAEDPLEALQAGDVDGAARLWAEALREKPQGSYTLQVLMACEAKSVRESYALYGSFGEAYTIPFSLKGRDCYRVGIGTYESLAAAKAALAGLPSEIRRSGAVVKSLGQFLPEALSPPAAPMALPEPSPVPEGPVGEIPKDKVREMSPDAYGEAMDAFQAGDLGGAAALWKRLLRQSPPGSYTLQVLTACDGDTVKNYFAFFEEHGRVFAVPLRLQGKDCYRVGLETYPSKKAAEAALRAMPAWVRDQRTVVKSVTLFAK